MFACLYGKCITEEPGILGGQKTMSGPLELGFPKAVSLWWVLGMEPLSLAKQQVLVTAEPSPQTHGFIPSPPIACLFSPRQELAVSEIAHAPGSQKFISWYKTWY